MTQVLALVPPKANYTHPKTLGCVFFIVKITFTTFHYFLQPPHTFLIF